MDDGTGVAFQARSPGRATTAIRDLHPGYFAFVMATGIISTGTFLLGPPWLSRALLVVASAGLAVLSAALVIRLVRFRPSVAADVHAPERVFGFFTISAGLDVLGVRLSYAGHPLATAILAGLAAAVWLVLTYEPTLWSVVFPLGMYSVATLSFGRAAGLAFMEPLSRFMLWGAVVAWVMVAAAFLARLVRRPGGRASAPPAAPAAT